MGVDYYDCDVCSSIFADCDDHGRCEACDRRWCEDCTQTNFVYGDDTYCPLCFPTEPLVPTEELILAHALNKLGVPREALIAEMLTLDMFREPQNRYTCQSTEQHDCEQMCTTLAEDFDAEALAFNDVTVARGLCCRIKYPDAEDKSHWCESCSNTGNKKAKK